MPDIKPDVKPPVNGGGPVPTVAPQPTPTVVYMMQNPPHVPPKPNVSPPGGKFGIVDVTMEDGQRIEKIRWVNAHGVEFREDEAENMDDVPARRIRDAKAHKSQDAPLLAGAPK